MKAWTSKAIQELLRQHEQDAAKATKPSKLPRLLTHFSEEATAVLGMVCHIVGTAICLIASIRPGV